MQISGFDRVYFRAFDHFVAQFLRECPHLTLPAIMNHHSSIPTNMRRKNLKSLGLHGRCLVVPCHPGSEVLSHDAACDFGYFFVKEQDVHRKPRKLHSYKRKNMCLTQDSTKYLETKTHEQKTPNTSKKTKSCCVGPFHCKDTHCHIGDQFQLQNNDKNLRSCPDLLDKRLRRKLRGPKSLPLLTDWMRCFVGSWDMLGYKCNIFPVGKRVLFLPISITHSIHVPTFIPSKSQQNIDVGKYTVRPMDPMLPCDFEDSGVLLLLIYIDSLVGNTHHPWLPGSKSLPISQNLWVYVDTRS